MNLLAQLSNPYPFCRALFACLLFVAISGCGFHLRGTQLLPNTFSSLDITCNDSAKVLCQKIKKTLSTQHVMISPSSSLHLTLNQFSEDRRAVSITTNAVASEYQLTLSQQFSLTYDAKDQPSVNLIDDSTVRASQSYHYNENAVLSSSREESQIRETLLTQLTSQLLRRLTPFNSDRIASEVKSQQSKAKN